MLWAVSQLKDHVVFAWTSKGDLWHVLSPVAVVPPWGEYYPRLCTREQFEKLVLVDVLLEQTQGGLALASNSYGYGGHFSHSLRLGAGNPISFTASVSPECEFVRWEFYASGEETPFLTADTQFVDMHWTQAKNTVARVVTRPKDEYKLRLETEVADPGTPGDDCPGYVVVEDAKTIGAISYHGPKRYYPKDGWVRLRPVANPGYRFVKWDAKTAVQAAVLGPLGTRTEEDLRGLKKENVAVCMQGETAIAAVFEPMLIVIDPGHGGSDPGAVKHGYKEKDFALDLGKRVRNKLGELSNGAAMVMLTRSTDVDIALEPRSNLARDNRASVFLSIHFNGGRLSPEEMLILVRKQDSAGTIESEKRQVNYGQDQTFAEEVLSECWSAYKKASQDIYGKPPGANGGVKYSETAVLSDKILGTYADDGTLSCDISAALIEVNEMGNDEFIDKWCGDAGDPLIPRIQFRDEVAEGIAGAILRYIGLDCAMSAPTE